MKYSVLRAASPPTLEKIVGGYLDNGWRPIGGIVINEDGFYRAVIKQGEQC